VTEETGRSLVHVSVVRGAPDDVELAALVAGLVAASGSADAPPAAATSAWADHARRLRRPGSAGTVALHGPDAWRWSLRD
jgi:acyl-CoA carboxylase epsilon subunit-like protein